VLLTRSHSADCLVYSIHEFLLLLLDTNEQTNYSISKSYFITPDMRCRYLLAAGEQPRPSTREASQNFRSEKYVRASDVCGIFIAVPTMTWYSKGTRYTGEEKGKTHNHAWIISIEHRVCSPTSLVTPSGPLAQPSTSRRATFVTFLDQQPFTHSPGIYIMPSSRGGARKFYVYCCPVCVRIAGKIALQFQSQLGKGQKGQS
jgi:hypothetical protein